MENVDKLAAALVKAQREMKGAKKDSENSFFKSKYADLGSVWEACHEALSANGIAVVQSPAFRDGHFFLTTTLLHSSGQTISGDYLIKPVKDDPQAYGSAYTYARRYSLAAMVGVISEDDDGNAASSPASQKQESQATQAVKTHAASQKTDGKTLVSHPFKVEKISEKAGETNGKPWLKVSVQDAEEAWFTTFDTKLGDELKAAKESGAPIVLDYQVNERGNKIVKVSPEESLAF